MYRELPRTESSECLGNMTPETQNIYLRMDHLRRRSGYRLGRIIARQQLLNRIAAEIEAREACDWLRAAGFPQYAQLFEDSQFPIDIFPVKKDHDFLDKDLVEPLLQNVLNELAFPRLDTEFEFPN
uniref:SAM domain-containing protein n=1 Tax=Sinocyclocheilus grahami TaxID=75366 RepID=A0A672MFK3_SINGR